MVDHVRHKGSRRGTGFIFPTLGKRKDDSMRNITSLRCAGAKENPSFRGPRLIRRDELFGLDPFCVQCRCKLTRKLWRRNSACLVFDVLACRDCSANVQKSERKRRNQQKTAMDARCRLGDEWTVDSSASPSPSSHRPKYHSERETQQLMDYDPHCAACGVLLVRDTATHPQLIGHRLSCPIHVNQVGKASKHGIDVAIVLFTEKGREYLASHIPPTPKRVLMVDGKPFDNMAEAEKAAIALADSLGCKIEILSGFEGGPFKRVEIVRPSSEARCGDSSWHFQRRHQIDVLPTC